METLAERTTVSQEYGRREKKVSSPWSVSEPNGRMLLLFVSCLFVWGQGGHVEARAAGPVLVFFDECESGVDNVTPALANLGISNVTVVYDDPNFADKLSSGSWQIVIVDSYGRGITASSADELVNYYDRGGRVIFSYWALCFEYWAQEFLDRAGVTLSGSYSTPEPIHSWIQAPLFTSPNPVPDMTVFTDRCDTDGQYAEPVTAIAHAGYTASPAANQAAITIDPQSRLILNAFAPQVFDQDEDSDGKIDMVELYENEIYYLVGCLPALPANPNPTDGATNVHIDADLSWIPCEVIEDFEDGDLSEYTIISGTFGVTAAAAHDGQYGLQSECYARSWAYRDDANVLVAQGDKISFWVRLQDTGRAYCGFGASPAGTYAIIAAPNTDEMLLQMMPNYGGYLDLGAVAQTWTFNKWYRMEVEWEVGGNMTGRLYDSDGVTLLNTVMGSDNTYTAGGIAFRAFDTSEPHVPDHFDTVERGSVRNAAARALVASHLPSREDPVKPEAADAIGWDEDNAASVFPEAKIQIDGVRANYGLYVLYFGTYTDTVTRLANLGYNVTGTTDVGDLVRSNLQNYDVLWIGVGVHPSIYDSQALEIQQWVFVDGGGFVVVQPSITGAIVTAYPTGFEVTITSTTHGAAPYAATIVDPTHPIVQRLTDADLSGDFDTVDQTDIGASWDIIAVDAVAPDEVALLAGGYGSGRMAFSTGNFAPSSYDPGSDQFVIHLLGWLGARLCPPTYDVYLWRDLLKPALICADTSQPTCDPGTLKYCTRYSWRVAAKNCCGETEGPIWSFTTVPYLCWDSPTQCHGDADNTGDVKGSDFLCLKNSWYKCYPDPLYDACCDFDRNGCVKGSDFLTLKNNWYQSVPPDCGAGGSCPPGAGK
jgi:hypothetical protein